jgi:hypothetical protein
MSKKYDYRRVPSYRSLKVRDIGRLYRDVKLSQQTIRGWINDGKLEAMLVGKTFYVYGAVLKQYLKDKSDERKKTLDFKECKCWYCKAVFNPIGGLVKRLAYGRNKSLVAYVHCPSCDKEVERAYKLVLLPEILKKFKVEKDEVTVLCDSSCSTRETNIDNGQKKPLCEPLKSKPPDKKPQTRSSTKTTHINEKQYSLF